MSGPAACPRAGAPAAEARTDARHHSPLTRRTLLGGLVSALALPAVPALAAAPAVLRRAGDVRCIALSNAHTGEWLDVAYWEDGSYIRPALEAVSLILRDWREGAVRRIDPAVIDILSATRALLDCDEPFTVVSGYRTPKTNAMLRRRSKAVAQNSYHCKGMAVDVRLKGRSVRQISRAALSLRGGGVGRYTRSGFVHLDCGPVRGWGS